MRLADPENYIPEHDEYVLECYHADTCLPDYWSGHHLPHVQIPVHKGMKLEEIKEALLSELNQGAIAGSANPELIESETWYHAAVNAVQAITPNDPDQVEFFMYLEDDPEGEWYDNSVYAFFVFCEVEE